MQTRSQSQDVQATADCAICLSPIDSASQVRLACGHTFHGQCAVTALQLDRRCPICRMKPQTNIEDEDDYDSVMDRSEDVVIYRLMNKVQESNMRLLLKDFGVPERFMTKQDVAEILAEQLHYETDYETDDENEYEGEE